MSSPKVRVLVRPSPQRFTGAVTYALGAGDFRRQMADAVGMDDTEWVSVAASGTDAWGARSETGFSLFRGDQMVKPLYQWSGVPWLTPVIGSGPVGVPQKFNEVAPQIGRVVAERVVELPEFAPGADAVARGGDEQVWVRQFVEHLIRIHTHASAEPDDAAPVPELKDSTVTFLAAAACLTRLHHRLSLDVSRPISSWGSSEPRVTRRDDLTGRFRVTREEFAKPLGVLVDRCESYVEGDQGGTLPFQVAQLLQAIGDSLAKENEVAANPLHVQQLTEVAWHLLVSDIADDSFPGWTALLIRLALASTEADALSMRRPRLSQDPLLVQNIRAVFAGAGAPQTSTTFTGDGFYGAVAETLWAQARARRTLSAAVRDARPLPVSAAISVSFDNELERALLRTAPAAGGDQSSFLVVIPVYVVGKDEIDNASATNVSGNFIWVQCRVSPGSSEPPVWRACLSTTVEDDGPVVIRLCGGPLYVPPDLDSAEATDLRSDLALVLGDMSKKGLRPAVTLDEFSTSELNRAETSLRLVAGTDERKPRAISPLTYFDPNDTEIAARRFWAMFGVPLRDPAVRRRLGSVFDLVYPVVSTPAVPEGPPPDAEAPVADDPFGLGDASPAPRSTERSVTTGGTPRLGMIKRRGCVFGRHIDEDEKSLMADLNFTVVHDADAAEVQGHLADYARWIHAGADAGGLL